jgi:hypothetical protein
MSTTDAEVTAENVTDEQIRDLYSDGFIGIDLKDLAMFGSRDERTEARARCAAVINARRGGSSC